MKTIAIIFLSLIGLRAFAQNSATLMVDMSGNIVAPSRSVFLHSNVFNQSGIIRSVDGPTNLFNAAPLRSGEHVIVIEAGTFGNGGAALFTHDGGSSNPTNTTDTLAASPGRWVVRTVFSTPPAWSAITGKPTSFAAAGLTNQVLPLAAGSNSPLSGDLYLGAFVMNGVRYTNVQADSGSITGSISATLLTGTIDELRIPSSILRSNDAAATYATINNPTFTGTVTIDNATIGVATVTNELIVVQDTYGSSWATKTNAPSKKDVYDKIESLGGSGALFVSGITGGSPMAIDDLFNMNTAVTAGDMGSAGANLGGSFQWASATNGAGRQGIRIMRVANTNSAPCFGWYDNRTFAFPTQGSTNQLFFGADIKTPDKTSGASATNIYSLQVGFNASSTADTNLPANFMGFIHQTNLIGTVNWAFGAVSNSAGVTWVDTGVAYTASSWYSLGARMDGDKSVGYINGVAVVTNSANLPYGRSAGASVRNAVISGTTTLDTTLNALAIQYK